VPPGPPFLWPARCHSLVWGLWRMVPVVGLFRCPSACPDLGAFFREIFLGHIGGHVEQNSVCRDTNAVDERNQPHLVFWLYFIIFLQYFPLFFRISLLSRGPPARWLLRTLWVVGAFPVPRGAAPRRAPTRRGPPFLPRNGGEEGRGPLSSIGGSVGNRRRVDPATWVPARSRAGIQAFSRESPDAKSRGGGPPPPHSMARSFPLARFGVVGRSGAVVGLFRGSSTCPDLGAFFFRISSGTQTKTAPVKCTGAGQNSIINLDPAHIPQRLPTNSAGFHITY